MILMRNQKLPRVCLCVGGVNVCGHVLFLHMLLPRMCLRGWVCECLGCECLCACCVMHNTPTSPTLTPSRPHTLTPSSPHTNHPPTHPHPGFQEQFQAITAAKGNNSVNLEYHMLQFTQGRIPKLIVCTGQSLGGALSTLCAAYMARKYPTATVLTTNEGAPKVGMKCGEMCEGRRGVTDVGRLWICMLKYIHGYTIYYMCV